MPLNRKHNSAEFYFDAAKNVMFLGRFSDAQESRQLSMLVLFA
jgi:hypothetical protein